MAKAYLICGSTGAGKSTLSKKLEQEELAHVFSIDEWMNSLFWADAPKTDVFPWAEERVRRCEDLMYLLGQRLLEKNQNVVFDLAYSTKEQRQKAYGFFRSSNLNFELIYLDVPVEVRLQRVKDRNRLKPDTYQFDVDEAMFNFMETIFEPPSEEELRNANGRRA